MASTAATTNGANEHDATIIARIAGGLLMIHGIQSWTVGNEHAWGRTSVEVSNTFFLHFNFHIIYFLHLFTFKKFKKYIIQKN